MTKSPSSLARRFYVDSVVYDEQALAALISWAGETQIMVGADYPYRKCEHDPVGRVNRLAIWPNISHAG